MCARVGLRGGQRLLQPRQVLGAPGGELEPGFLGRGDLLARRAQQRFEADHVGRQAAAEGIELGQPEYLLHVARRPG